MRICKWNYQGKIKEKEARQLGLLGGVGEFEPWSWKSLEPLKTKIKAHKMTKIKKKKNQTIKSVFKHMKNQDHLTAGGNIKLCKLFGK